MVAMAKSQRLFKDFDWLLLGAALLLSVISLAEIYNIRLEYGRVFDAGDDSTLDEADVDMATLNVTVSF